MLSHYFFLVKGDAAATHLAYVLGHSQGERLDIIQRFGMNELPVVEPEANPEVIHEQRKKSHHERDANGATKLIARGPERSVCVGRNTGSVRLPLVGIKKLVDLFALCRGLDNSIWDQRRLFGCLSLLRFRLFFGFV